jgi:hypothetical protein
MPTIQELRGVAADLASGIGTAESCGHEHVKNSQHLAGPAAIVFPSQEAQSTGIAGIAGMSGRSVIFVTFDKIHGITSRCAERIFKTWEACETAAAKPCGEVPSL